MKVKCIDNGNDCGTGDGLLTRNKIYNVSSSLGGYYNVLCDNGKTYTKCKTRFTTKGVKQ